MDGLLFDLGLPDETIELIIEKAGGRQLRIAKPFSKSNRLFRGKRNKHICQKRLAGGTLEELVGEFKLKKNTICKILRENGIKIREEKKRTLVEDIKLLLQLKTPITRIAKKTGYSRAWIYEFIKKEGLR